MEDLRLDTTTTHEVSAEAVSTLPCECLIDMQPSAVILNLNKPISIFNRMELDNIWNVPVMLPESFTVGSSARGELAPRLVLSQCLL